MVGIRVEDDALMTGPVRDGASRRSKMSAESLEKLSSWRRQGRSTARSGGRRSDRSAEFSKLRTPEIARGISRILDGGYSVIYELRAKKRCFTASSF